MIIDVVFTSSETGESLIIPCEGETFALQIAASGLCNVEWTQATFSVWGQDFVLTREEPCSDS